jgi:glycosyltransferase involved in cell wall biosynthesis
MTPRVSVVIPTHDRLAALQRALASVAAQRYRDFEVLVVDDACTDDTAAWLDRQRAIRRIASETGPVGAAAARNRGVAEARGGLIAFLDDDDCWQPTYLERQVAHLESSGRTVLSYAGHLEIDRQGHVSRPDTRPLMSYASSLVNLLAECFIHTMSVVVCRREAFDRAGPFDDRLTIVHDLDWYARLLVAGSSFSALPGAEPLVARAVPGGLVQSHERWFAEEQQVLARIWSEGRVRPADETLIRATRSLFFARLAIARGDFTFGLRRLAEAVAISPRWTVTVAVRRLVRRFGYRLRPGPAVDGGDPIPVTAR